MKVRLNFETDAETIRLVSEVIKWAADQTENDLSERQRTDLTNFALNLLRAKNEHSDEHPEIGTIAKTFFDYMGAKIEPISTELTDD